MNPEKIRSVIDTIWQESIVNELVDYIRVPAKSPDFDPDWQHNGYIDKVVEQAASWCRTHSPRDMQLEVIRLEGRTPVLFAEIPGQSEETVLLYGHLDKQPEMTGWEEGLGPWEPVIRDGRLFGRGGADDGYAAYASLAAILALQEQGIPHARCVMLIETCEESGSYDLPYYIEHLKPRIGEPSLVVCLDSGAGNYEQLWSTVSLRGMVSATLRADVLTEGLHSGSASGIAPSSFRVLRNIIERIEDSATGRVLLPEFHTDIPPDRVEEVQALVAELGDGVWNSIPFAGDCRPMGEDNVERVLNRTWRPTLSVTGVDGIPSVASGGNVLRPATTLKLSFRLPPTVQAGKAIAALEKAALENPVCRAAVSVEAEGANGWNAPAIAPWLRGAMDSASQTVFDKPAMCLGEGGTIPFMGMLGEAYPRAQFLITGVLGPNSNAHGPNEFLDIPYAQKLTACVSHVLADHFQRDD